MADEGASGAPRRILARLRGEPHASDIEWFEAVSHELAELRRALHEQRLLLDALTTDVKRVEQGA